RLTVVSCVAPHPHFPVRIFVVLLYVSGETFNIVMNQTFFQLAGPAAHHHVLMHFHIAHGSVLVLRPAFKATLTSSKESHLVKMRPAMTKALAEKEHFQAEVKPVDTGITYRTPNLSDKFRRQ